MIMQRFSTDFHRQFLSMFSLHFRYNLKEVEWFNGSGNTQLTLPERSSTSPVDDSGAGVVKIWDRLATHHPLSPSLPRLPDWHLYLDQKRAFTIRVTQLASSFRYISVTGGRGRVCHRFCAFITTLSLRQSNIPWYYKLKVQIWIDVSHCGDLCDYYFMDTMMTWESYIPRW